MRQLLIILYLFLSTSFIPAKTYIQDLFFLDGTWVPVAQEISGTTLPASSFKDQKLILADSSYNFTAESVDKGTISYRDGKMNIYGKEGVNSGKHFMSIYKIENGLLTICYNLAGDNYPETFSTKEKSKYFLCVFKKLDAHNEP